LVPIQMSAGLLAQDVRPSDRRRSKRPIEIIERASGRMQGLLLDLLDASAVEAGRLAIRAQEQDVAALVDDACITIEPQLAAKALRLEKHLDERVALVLCDGKRIGQVLGNLLSNAVRYSPHGECITMRVASRPHELEFAVTDRGVGIPEIDQERLFRRFNKGAEGQHGLGLYIARSFVEAHGGKIWVVSEPGQGSSFRFTLPITPPA
jgi:signal transduction histidine kinase